jgi:hypothetical protein
MKDDLEKKMKLRFLVLAGLALSLWSADGWAAAGEINRNGSLGLGAEFGQPIGATGKYWFSEMSAVDGALGYHFNHNFDLHADYLAHLYVLSGGSNAQLPLYGGLGARILAGDDTQFGLRIPLGISYLLMPHRLEIFAEVAPVIDLSNIGVDVDGVVGLRLYSF